MITPSPVATSPLNQINTQSSQPAIPEREGTTMRLNATTPAGSIELRHPPTPPHPPHRRRLLPLLTTLTLLPLLALPLTT